MGKRMIAIILIVSMVLGSTLTAYAQNDSSEERIINEVEDTEAEKTQVEETEAVGETRAEEESQEDNKTIEDVSSGMIFEIVEEPESTDSNGKASLISCAEKQNDETYGRYIVPEMVSLDEQKYQVTAICQEAFSSVYVEEIVIPDTVEVIDEKVFKEHAEVTFYCNTGSIAEKYGQEHSYQCITDSVRIVCEGETKLETGKTVQLQIEKPEILPSENDIKWDSDNEEFGKVDESGLVTGIQAGTANISVSVDGLKATVTLEIMEPVVEQAEETNEPEASTQNVEIVASGECGDNLTWTIGTDHVLTISGTGDMYDYGYPDTPWKTYIVDSDKKYTLEMKEGITRIGSDAFYSCSGFTGNLTIPDSVTTIGGRAFIDCSGFTGNLTIPDSVTTIGGYAFYSCSGFTGNLIIPDSVTTTGIYAFKGCSGFAGNLTIPDSVTTIGESAFEGCSGFTGNLTIGNGVTTIEGSAFEGCSGFTGNLTIPDSVTTVGCGAFKDCSGFTGDLTIPDSVTTIGGYGGSAFKGCSGFTGHLTIGNGITMIGRSAFEGCSGFTGDLTIPDSVTTIEEYAFEYCSGFTGNLTIGNGVTMIEDRAFSGCSGFTGNLTIGNGVTMIEEKAFWGCSGFTGNLTISDSVTTIGKYAFEYCSGFTGNLTIGNGVTTIGYSAFEGCSGFTGDLTIPDSVTTIGGYGGHAFKGCSGFTGNLTIGNGITRIGGSAFSGCSGFTGNLTIGNGVTRIEGGAFYSCSGFTGDLTIPDSVTTIGESAFEYCSGFTGDLTISDSVTTIGDGAFSRCSGFTGILTIGNSVTAIGGIAFANCSNITDISFSGNAPDFIDYYAFNRITATVYYPMNNATWTEDKRKNYGGHLTWKPYSSTDNDDITESAKIIIEIRDENTNKLITTNDVSDVRICRFKQDGSGQFYDLPDGKLEVELGFPIYKLGCYATGYNYIHTKSFDTVPESKKIVFYISKIGAGRYDTGAKTEEQASNLSFLYGDSISVPKGSNVAICADLKDCENSADVIESNSNWSIENSGIAEVISHNYSIKNINANVTCNVRLAAVVKTKEIGVTKIRLCNAEGKAIECTLNVVEESDTGSTQLPFIIPDTGFHDGTAVSTVENWLAYNSVYLDMLMDNSNYLHMQYTLKNEPSMKSWANIHEKSDLGNVLNVWTGQDSISVDYAEALLLDVLSGLAEDELDKFYNIYYGALKDQGSANKIISKSLSLMNELDNDKSYGDMMKYVGNLMIPLKATESNVNEIRKSYAEMLSVKASNAYYKEMLSYISRYCQNSNVRKAAGNLSRRASLSVAQNLEEIKEEANKKAVNGAVVDITTMLLQKIPGVSYLSQIKSMFDQLDHGRLKLVSSEICMFYIECTLSDWCKSSIDQYYTAYTNSQKSQACERIRYSVNLLLYARAYGENILKGIMEQERHQFGNPQSAYNYNSFQSTQTNITRMKNVFFGTNSSLFFTTGIIMLYCPIDVDVCKEDGTVVASLKNGTEEIIENDYGYFQSTYCEETDDYIKTIHLYGTEKYRIVTRAVDSGSVRGTAQKSNWEGDGLEYNFSPVEVSVGNEIVLENCNASVEDAIPKIEVMNQEETTSSDMEQQANNPDLLKADFEKQCIVGETCDLYEMIVKEGYENGKIAWSSLDSEIVKVDENGIVSALSQGSTKVVAKNEAGKIIGVCLVQVLDDLSLCNVEGLLSEYTYSGEDLEPDFIVVDVEGNRLAEGVDYKKTYINNLDAGMGSVCVEGLNNYKGKLIRTYTVLQKNNIFPESEQGLKKQYTAKPVEISLANGEDLKWRGDGQATIEGYYLDAEGITPTTANDGSGASEDGTAPINAGAYFVKINVSSEVEADNFVELVPFSIEKLTPEASNFTFTLPANATYDGNARSAIVEIKQDLVGMGEITVKYKAENAEEYTTNAPKAPGVYDVYLDIADGKNYTELQELLLGSFEIIPIRHVVQLTSQIDGSSDQTTVAQLTGGGTFDENSTVTVTAPDKEGYKFLGWFEATKNEAGEITGYDKALQKSTDLKYEFKLTADCAFVAVYEANGNVLLSVSGANYSIEYNGTESATQDGSFNEHIPLGSKITIRIKPENTNFVYWKNGNNKKVSTSEDYTFVLAGETTLVMAKKATEDASAFVEFVSEYGQVITGQVYNATIIDSAKLPTGPSKIGYTFKSWSLTKEQIKEKIQANEKHISVRPLYDELNETYYLKVFQVYDGTLLSETPSMDTVANAGDSKNVSAPMIDGKKFKCWAADQKGKIVLGTQNNYFVQISSDTTLYAVYVDAEVEVKQVPTIAITNKLAFDDNGVSKISFISTRSIPEGYTLIEHGMLYGTTKLDDAIFVDGTEGVKKFVSSTTGAAGVFTFNITVGSKKDTTVYDRAYMLVKNDATGNEEYYYSVVENGTYNTLITK